MKKLSMILGAIAFAVSGAAIAGGVDQATPAPQASNNGFYVGAESGAAIPSNVDGVIKTGYLLGGLVGYKYGNFRFEGNLNYTNNNTPQVVIFNNTFRAKFRTLTVMGNVIYDIKLNSPFVPFIGAGLGWAHSWVVGDTDQVSVGELDSDNVFAYQAIAGLGYMVTKNVGLNVTYKFRGFTNSGGLHQNLITGGLNYYFS